MRRTERPAAEEDGVLLGWMHAHTERVAEVSFERVVAGQCGIAERCDGGLDGGDHRAGDRDLDAARAPAATWDRRPRRAAAPVEKRLGLHDLRLDLTGHGLDALGLGDRASQRGRHAGAGVVGERRTGRPGDADVQRRVAEARDRPWPRRDRGRRRRSSGDLRRRLGPQLDVVVDDVVGVRCPQSQVVPGLDPGDARRSAGTITCPTRGSPPLVGDRPHQVVRQCVPPVAKALCPLSDPARVGAARWSSGQTAAGGCTQLGLGPDRVDQSGSVRRAVQQVGVDSRRASALVGRLASVQGQVVGGEQGHRGVALARGRSGSARSRAGRVRVRRTGGRRTR